MNKKAKTIGMILLVTLLLAVPGAIAFGEMGNGQVGEREIPELTREDQPPPPLIVEWRQTDEYMTLEPFPIRMVELVIISCESERRPEREFVPWPDAKPLEDLLRAPPPPITDGSPPAHYEAARWVDGRWVEVSPYRDKTQDPDGDVGIAAISSEDQPPYRSGLNAHGRAWTRAHYESGVITQVVVDVWLQRWDGAAWATVGFDFDCESTACWRGLITARGLAIGINASTGWYRVISLHRVYVDGVRVYNRGRQSDHVWLVFP